MFDDPDASGGRGKKKEDWTLDEGPAQPENKWFQRLARAMADDPERVGMYQKGGKCLWMSDPSMLLATNPKCRRCGARCHFEFQLLPSLLYLGGEYGVWSAEQRQQEDVSVGVVLESAVVVAEDDAQEEEGQAVVAPDGAINKEVLAKVEALEERANLLSPLPEFGVVAVYSCSKSCAGDALEEHVIVQRSI